MLLPKATYNQQSLGLEKICFHFEQTKIVLKYTLLLGLLNQM